MYLHEAYQISETLESTLDELLEAHEVICAEKGYILAIAARQLESGTVVELESKIWKLVLAIATLKSRIKAKSN